MGKCVIFCAGEFDALLEDIPESALVIAADGGLRHALSLGLTPDVILGDFDSLGYIPQGAAVFPVEKDDTDAMLAIRHGLERGCREFMIYGGLDGPRLDHTLANLQALQFLIGHGARGYLVGLRQIVTAVTEETIRFPESAAGICSLFCLGADAEGVTVTGLQYPLRDGRLTSGFPLGVSNHFTGAAGTIGVKDGTVIALWDRENGLPERIPFVP